jgi:hypothetical protein
VAAREGVSTGGDVADIEFVGLIAAAIAAAATVRNVRGSDGHAATLAAVLTLPSGVEGSA